jgi:ATP-dependent exoDNAse (exonuclease V) alpha subunit
LTICHRVDDEESALYKNCQSIVNGDCNNFIFNDTFNLVEGNEETVLSIIKHFKSNGFTADDICCITPYNKSVASINKEVSELFNGDQRFTEPAMSYKKIKWHINDKVMATGNIYSLNIMNGESGIIINITGEPFYEVTVQFSGSRFGKFKYWKTSLRADFVDYNEDSFDMPDINGDESDITTHYIMHSYCLTVHKSQGSEIDYGIYFYPSISTYGYFITKELIYTQFSRSKVGAYLVIPPKSLHTLQKCCYKSIDDYRMDYLSERIKELLDT